MADKKLRGQELATQKQQGIDQQQREIEELKQLPQLLMNEEARTKIEKLIKQFQKERIELLNHNKDTTQSTPNPSSGNTSKRAAQRREDIISSLLKERFELDDIEKAFHSLEDEEHRDILSITLPNILDWLCLHIPENRLPFHYGPMRGTLQFISNNSNSNSSSNNSNSNRNSDIEDIYNALSFQQVQLVNKIHSLGFSLEDTVNSLIAVESILQQQKSDSENNIELHQLEDRVLYYLFHKLEGQEDTISATIAARSDPHQNKEAVEEELMVLESIFGGDDQGQQQFDKTVDEGGNVTQIVIKLQENTAGLDGESRLAVYLFPELINYPNEVNQTFHSSSFIYTYLEISFLILRILYFLPYVGSGYDIA